mmetsp:Transcript_36550/g.105132  ORF Transcript_36550/g.105132 Transcript_36550/m.105132 type:complete len:252 (+) Transcript_36550:494-1249(+)
MKFMERFRCCNDLFTDSASAKLGVASLVRALHDMSNVSSHSFFASAAAIARPPLSPTPQAAMPKVFRRQTPAVLPLSSRAKPSMPLSPMSALWYTNNSCKASKRDSTSASMLTPVAVRPLFPRCRRRNRWLFTMAWAAMSASAKALGNASCLPKKLSLKSNSSRGWLGLMSTAASSSMPVWRMPFQAKFSRLSLVLCCSTEKSSVAAVLRMPLRRRLSDSNVECAEGPLRPDPGAEPKVSTKLRTKVSEPS